MKKIFLFALCALSVLALNAQKSTFVSQDNLDKVQANASKDANWPKFEKIFSVDLSAGKTKEGAWQMKGGNLVSVSENEPLFINKSSDQFALAFEFTAEEDAEGFIFVRAPNGDVSKALKIRIGAKHVGGKTGKLGSLIDAVEVKDDAKLDEPKDGKWVRVLVSVEGGNLRVAGTHRISGYYRDRSFATYDLADVAKVTGQEIPADGDFGIVATKGVLKFKQMQFTQF